MELEASIIKKIPFCLSPQSDVLTWPHNSVGEYSLKFGYRFLQEESLKQQPGPSNFVALRPLWQAIWKLDISSKVRNPVWRACWNSLPMKINLVKRRVVKEDRRDLCQISQKKMSTMPCFFLSKIGRIMERGTSVESWQLKTLYKHHWSAGTYFGRKPWPNYLLDDCMGSMELKEQPAIGKTIVTAGKNSAGCKRSCSGIPKRPHSHGCSLSPPSRYLASAWYKVKIWWSSLCLGKQGWD